MNDIQLILHGTLALVRTLAGALRVQPARSRIDLRHGWDMNSSAMVKDDAAAISSQSFKPQGWYSVSVPTAVLNALAKQGFHPDMRISHIPFQASYLAGRASVLRSWRIVDSETGVTATMPPSSSHGRPCCAAPLPATAQRTSGCLV